MRKKSTIWKAIKLTLLLLLTACGQNKEIIRVEIDLEKITVENKEIDKAQFETELKQIVEDRIESGLTKSDMIIHVYADTNLSTTEMSEFEKAIRRAGVNRDYSWTNRPDR